MTIDVRPLRRVTDDTVAALGPLVRRLSTHARLPDRDELTRIVECPTNTVLIAYLDDRMVGMLTLVVFPIPTGIRAWIEDVVVDQDAGRQGIGTALTNEAIRIGHEQGARSIDLTSRPARVAANRLYEKLGFELRDSKVYRLER
jgi:ribosomal protein S18 acetylase RimI-like enzyme